MVPLCVIATARRHWTWLRSASKQLSQSLPVLSEARLHGLTACTARGEGGRGRERDLLGTIERERARARACEFCARLSPPRVLLPHTNTQDGWFLQPKRRPARLPRRTLFSRCTCRCSSLRARLSSPPRPPPSHIDAGWMISATKTPTSSAPSQEYLFPLHM